MASTKETQFSKIKYLYSSDHIRTVVPGAPRLFANSMSPSTKRATRRQGLKASPGYGEVETSRFPSLNKSRPRPNSSPASIDAAMPARFLKPDPFDADQDTSAIEVEREELSKWTGQPIASTSAAAHNGDKYAQAVVGAVLTTARGPDEQREAVQWLRKSAQAGVSDAQCRLGLMYASGKIVLADTATALVWLERAANRQNASAMVSLGRLLRQKRGASASDKQASFKWICRAAQLGNHQAAVHVAAATAAGFVAHASPERAIQLLNQQDPVAHPEALYLAAYLECTVQQSSSMSHGLFRLVQSAEAGDERAQYLLSLQQLGSSSPASSDAYSMMKSSADSGFVPAQFHLGLLFIQADESETEARGTALLLQAAAAGYQPAEHILRQFSVQDKLSHNLKSWIAARGCDTVPPLTAAPALRDALSMPFLVPQTLAEMQACNGNAQAALNLSKYALFLAKSSGKQSRKAVKWALLAADCGSAESALLLHDIGVQREVSILASKTPEEWLELAAGRAYPAAQLQLAVQLQSAEQVEKQRAFSLLVGAAAQNNTEAQYQCALALRDGSGTGVDPVAAHGWLLKAAEAGHASACRVLATSMPVAHAAGTSTREELLAKAIIGGDCDAPSRLVESLVQDVGKSSSLTKELLALGLQRKSHHAHELYATFILQSEETERFPKAVTALRFATRGGSSSSLHLLGRCYWRGQGVTQNEQQAEKLLSKASSLGNDEAKFDLGRLWFETFQYDEALRCFCQVGDSGNPEAAYMAGYIQMKELASNSSTKAALLWFKLAAQAGHANAHKVLSKLIPQLVQAADSASESITREKKGIIQQNTNIKSSSFRPDRLKAAHTAISAPNAATLKGGTQPSEIHSQGVSPPKNAPIIQQHQQTENIVEIDALVADSDAAQDAGPLAVGDSVVLFSFFANRFCPSWLSMGTITQVLPTHGENVPQLYGFKANGDTSVIFVPHELLRRQSDFGSHQVMHSINAANCPPMFPQGSEVYVRSIDEVGSWQKAVVVSVSAPHVRRPCYTYAAETEIGDRRAALSFEMCTIRPALQQSYPSRFSAQQIVWVPRSVFKQGTMQGSTHPPPVWVQAEIVEEDVRAMFPNDRWTVRSGSSEASVGWQEIRQFTGMLPDSVEVSGLRAGSEALLWSTGRGLQMVQQSVLIEGIFCCSSTFDAMERMLCLVRVHRGHQVPFLVPGSMLCKHDKPQSTIKPTSRQATPQTNLARELVDSPRAGPIVVRSARKGKLSTSGGAALNRALSSEQAKERTSATVPNSHSETKAQSNAEIPAAANPSAAEKLALAILGADDFNDRIPNSELKRALEQAVSGSIVTALLHLVSYYRKHGTQGDKAKVPQLLQRGADAGNADAVAELAFMHETGENMGHVDGVKAARMYKQALSIDAGCMLAASRLGQAHALGHLGVKVEFSTAVRLLRIACKQDDAALQLAKLLCRGPDPEGDSHEICQLLAECTGVREAHYVLADHLLSLRDIEQHTRGKTILSSLAAEGDERAALKIAQLDAPPAEFEQGAPVRVAYTRNGRRFVFLGRVASVRFTITHAQSEQQGRYRYKVALDSGGFCTELTAENLTHAGEVAEKAVQWGEDQVHDVEATGKQRKLSKKPA